MFRYLFLILLFPILFSAAQASENLSFDTPLNSGEAQRLQKHFQKNGGKIPDKIDVARADLNEDGIDEFLVKIACFPEEKLCDYRILAETGEEITELGAMKAVKIGLGSGYSEGVRNLLAYRNPANDFDHNVYIWKSEAIRYIMKE